MPVVHPSAESLPTSRLRRTNPARKGRTNHAFVPIVLPGAEHKFPMQMISSFRPFALMCAAPGECSFWTE